MRFWLSKLIRQSRHAQDPDFGKITYMGGYWEGTGVFPPTQSEAEYFVTADEHGPSDANRQAFHIICSNYAGLLERAATVISSETQSVVNACDLSISSMDVPSGDLDASTWEMNFSGADDTFYSVEYNGLDATGAVDVSY